MNTYVEQIDETGICRIPNYLSDQQVKETLSLTRQWHETMKNNRISERKSMGDVGRYVWNLQNKDYRFLELLFAAHTLRTILMHYLNDPWHKSLPDGTPNYILRSYLARSSTTSMPLHIDSFVPYCGDHTIAMQVGIVLQSHAPNNGAFVVVPGSHKSGDYATQDALGQTVAMNPKAGDLLIWDARLWHGCLANKTGNTRWMLIGTFTRWWIKQMFRMTESLPDEIYGRLSDEQRAIMGFCSIPHWDETTGLNVKQGYEVLKPRVADYAA